jgi:hypothetical protein
MTTDSRSADSRIDHSSFAEGMRCLRPIYICIIATITLELVLTCGCSDLNRRNRTRAVSIQSAPLGTLSDAVWLDQEQQAEASEFVMYSHEFKLRSRILNMDGEDHVKQIASRLRNGADIPVIVERSMDNNQVGLYHYPVNPNPELDNQRREIVVAALMQLGIPNANEIVVVAPAFATSANGQEAEAAFQRGLGIGFTGNSFGGGFGGFGGFGAGGAIGGGVGGGIGDASSSDTSSDLSSTP